MSSFIKLIKNKIKKDDKKVDKSPSTTNTLTKNNSQPNSPKTPANQPTGEPADVTKSPSTTNSSYGNKDPQPTVTNVPVKNEATQPNHGEAIPPKQPNPEPKPVEPTPTKTEPKETKTEQKPAEKPVENPTEKPTATNPSKTEQPINNAQFLLTLEDAGPPEIDPSEIEYNELRDFLGQGSFGKVYAGRCRGKRVAVKVPLKQDLSEKELLEFRHEVALMKRIFHPNCVLFMGACTEKGQLKIITELMYTDMENLLKSSRPLTVIQKVKMGKDAALGVNWLHGITNIIHRDLKPANFLVDENLVVKVTDFGFSQLKPDADSLIEQKGVARGTPLWMSPEVMMGQKFNEKCDVYSFGIILWQMLTRQEPFQHHTDFREFRNCVCKKNERPPLPADTMPSFASLIKLCWQGDFTQRPSFNEIIKALDDILLECHLASELPRKFWRENFVAVKNEFTENIPWADFVNRLQMEILYKQPESARSKYTADMFKKLKDILTESTLDNKVVVTIQKFNTVVHSFGNFFLPNEEGLRILTEIRDVIDKDWFHGDISKDVAEKRLANRPEGTFLVRISTTTPEFPFTISMINNQHRRIRHDPGSDYSFKGSANVYKALTELVEHNLDTKLVDLRFPCAKSILNTEWGYT